MIDKENSNLNSNVKNLNKHNTLKHQAGERVNKQIKKHRKAKNKRYDRQSNNLKLEFKCKKKKT